MDSGKRFVNSMYKSSTFGTFVMLDEEVKRGLSRKVAKRKALMRNVISRFDLSMPPLIPPHAGGHKGLNPAQGIESRPPLSLRGAPKGRRGNPLRYPEITPTYAPCHLALRD